MRFKLSCRFSSSYNVQPVEYYYTAALSLYPETYTTLIWRLLTENAEVTDIVNFSPLCPTIQSG